MKKIIALALAAVLALGLMAGCGTTETTTSNPPADDGGEVSAPPADDTAPDVELTATQQIIAEAETMTLEELAAKAIE